MKAINFAIFALSLSLNFYLLAAVISTGPLADWFDVGTAGGVSGSAGGGTTQADRGSDASNPRQSPGGSASRRSSVEAVALASAESCNHLLLECSDELVRTHRESWERLSLQAMFDFGPRNSHAEARVQDAMAAAFANTGVHASYSCRGEVCRLDAAETDSTVPGALDVILHRLRDPSSTEGVVCDVNVSSPYGAGLNDDEAAPRSPPLASPSKALHAAPTTKKREAGSGQGAVQADNEEAAAAAATGEGPRVYVRLCGEEPVDGFEFLKSLVAKLKTDPWIRGCLRWDAIGRPIDVRLGVGVGVAADRNKIKVNVGGQTSPAARCIRGRLEDLVVAVSLPPVLASGVYYFQLR